MDLDRLTLDKYASSERLDNLHNRLVLQKIQVSDSVIHMVEVVFGYVRVSLSRIERIG